MVGVCSTQNSHTQIITTARLTDAPCDEKETEISRTDGISYLSPHTMITQLGTLYWTLFRKEKYK